MYTVIMVNAADEIDPAKKAHKAEGRTFPTMAQAQENADKRNSQIPERMQGVKKYVVVELSVSAQREIAKRGETLTVGERARRVKAAF